MSYYSTEPPGIPVPGLVPGRVPRFRLVPLPGWGRGTQYCARLKFNTETFGFEEELEEIAADIETEVYAFLFKGKKAQLELFGLMAKPAPGLNAEKVEDNGLFPDINDPADDPEPNDETAEM